MKRYLLSLVLCSDIFFGMAQPGSWQQKSSLGWNGIVEPTGRYAAVAFSIGNKGYIGTGYDNSGNRKDLWQYDPIADAWTQKADFGGSPREFAVGFVIGGKGYIGLGDSAAPNPETTTAFSDLWEYDTAANSWTQKSGFPGGARSQATAFSIGGKEYVGTGAGGNGYSFYNDFWEYDPVADSWTQKAAFGGAAREGAIGFSIGGTGYVGTGNNGNEVYSTFLPDFWEYDPVADNWTQKASFGGPQRTLATGFSIGNKGYVGLGFYSIDGFSPPSLSYSDFWEYDPVSDSWVNKANFAGSPRNGAAGFTIGGDGYIVSGGNSFQGTLGLSQTGVFANDCWKYDTLADSWTQVAHFGAAGRAVAIGFGIGGKGYLGMGITANAEGAANLTDFWEYDTLADNWSQKASFPAGARLWPVGFAIGSKGYAGLGESLNGDTTDFWAFDPVLNTWTQRSSFPGAGRQGLIGLSIGNKGYVGLGSINGGNVNDFWAFDTLANSWTQMASFPGSNSSQTIGFSAGNKGYIGLGNGLGSQADSALWEYDPAVDSWTHKNGKYPDGNSLYRGVAFAIGNNGYVGGGPQNNHFWEYDPVADSWSGLPGFPGGWRLDAVGFNIGGRGYMGTGSYLSDFWQYATEEAIRTAVGDYSVSSACPVISGSGFAWAADSSNGLIFGINPNNNNLGATCWGFRNVAAGDYRDSLGWFGGSQPQFGAYLNRNYLITPASEPGSAVTLRLYCTAGELTNFVNYFNAAYGTAYTQNDISIVRYDGINQDLDPTNNSNLATDYTAITPDSIGVYGSAGEYRYFEFSSASLSEFYLTLSSPISPLPVNLLNFSAVYDDGASILHWQTAQEQNSSRFDIQRSADGNQFTSIGSAPAAGNSTSIRSYNFTDANAGSLGVKTLYYRLGEIALDSQEVYSNIAVVNIPGISNGISVSPNPATDNITVHLNSTAANVKAVLTITDMTGGKIQTWNIMLNTGENTIPLSINNLSAGIYLIVVTSDQTKWLAKFVKK